MFSSPESPAPIAVLADDLVDQIAAGEVIERPASVVKELVENALDAKATHITVEVEGGGKRLIRVIDDGWGMEPEAARLALVRHATSKIRRFEDLHALSTMGFRGEALPSIASVSRMTLTTRARTGQIAATRIEIDAGQIRSTSEVGAPVGTLVEVQDLLHNIPARLKFLKGDATETSHITDAVQRLAMAHPGVHIRLRHGSRKAIDAPPHATGLDRARALLGNRLGRRLHAATGEEGGARVEVYLAPPDLALSTSRGVQLYVGRRFIRDRGLLHAVLMGYGELIPRGRYPAAVVFVDLPQPGVDVNVHPQKLEVRFAEADRVYAAVRHTIRRAVAKAPWLADGPAPGAAPVRMDAVAMTAPPARGRASDLATAYARAQERTLFSRRGSWRLPPPVTGSPASAPGRPSAKGPTGPTGDRVVRAAVEPEGGVAKEAAEPRGRAGGGEASSELADGRGRELEERQAKGEPEEPAGFFSQLRYIGQLDRTYLLCEQVCEQAGELVLLDQHAAHERVEFQRLRELHAERGLPVQRLLFPQRMELSPAEVAVAQELRDELVAVGFELEPFGGASYALKAAPAGLRGAGPDEVLRQLLAELAENGGSRALEESLDDVFATIACHSVVRAGDILSPAEAQSLLTSLDRVDFKAHCPHGRPVLLRISVAEESRVGSGVPERLGAVATSGLDALARMVGSVPGPASPCPPRALPIAQRSGHPCWW